MDSHAVHLLTLSDRSDRSYPRYLPSFRLEEEMTIPGRSWDFGFQLTLSQTTVAVMA